VREGKRREDGEGMEGERRKAGERRGGQREKKRGGTVGEGREEEERGAAFATSYQQCADILARLHNDWN